MLWRFSVATVFLVAIATTANASWKWGSESNPGNTTTSASTVSSSSSATSTLTSRTTVYEDIAHDSSETLTETTKTEGKQNLANGTVHLDSIGNDTEPRFIGGLKKKLCSVGLGINNGKIFECKNVDLKKKVRIPRDTKEDKEEKNEQSPRLLGLLGGLIGGSGLDGIFKGPAFVPSFGVNFGSLPTGGGYSPYGTPYGAGGFGGHGSNPLGLDLGPVSINPFVGFKVAKFDGRPVFNPSLDLLVTPNAEGVHAIEKIKHGLKDPFGLSGGGGYPPGPYPGGHYPYGPSPGGHYPHGAGYYGGGYHGNKYPAGGIYPPTGGLYPPTGGLYPPTNGLYPQTGGFQSSLYSPQTYRPPSTPYAPSYSPSKPVYTPPYTPSKPIYTPPYASSKPGYSPPIYTPPATPFHRPKPVADFSTQIHNNPLLPSRPPFTPSVPIHTPSRPLHNPSSFLHNEKPVEVHHHEHTHFHDHDHDHSNFNHNGLGTIFRGGRFQDKNDSPLSNRNPLSNSALTFSPSSSSSNRFVLPASNNSPNSVLSPRSIDSNKSGSDSSFKFPSK